MFDITYPKTQKKDSIFFIITLPKKSIERRLILYNIVISLHLSPLHHIINLYYIYPM